MALLKLKFETVCSWLEHVWACVTLAWFALWLLRVRRSEAEKLSRLSSRKNRTPVAVLKDRLVDEGAAANTSTSPVWLLNRRRNKSHSIVYGYPSELLLKVFGEADFLTQQMIRSSCSRFAELIASLDLERAQKSFDPGLTSLPVWPCHGTMQQRRAVRRQWGALVRRDRSNICQKCQYWEQSGKLENCLWWLDKCELWCHSCCSFHPRGMFSSSQRKFWASPRMCIGWEGRLRLCSHVSLSWSEVETEMQRRNSCGQRGGRERPFVPLVRCPESCHWSGSYNSFWSEEAEPPKLNSRYYIWRSMFDPRPVPELAATWANYVFDIDADRPLTRHVFREALDKLSTGGSGPSLCPHVQFDDGQLLLPLQPAFCCCFPDRLQPEYRVNQHRHFNCERNTCRWRTDSDANPQIKTIALEAYQGGFSHTYTCYTCKACYFWRRQGNTFHLEFYTSIPVDSVSSEAWIRKLDPHSWGITHDVETRHVYWCPNAGCGTNHRWDALYRRLRIYEIKSAYYSRTVVPQPGH